jgi:hypothetical protein
MKKILILSTLVCFATICSCQKQDSAAETRLAQRTTELDRREAALDEREKGLDVRERALAERPKAAPNTSAIQLEPQLRPQVPNAAEAKAERDRRIEQLPPEFRALITDAESRRQKRDPSDPAQARTERQLRPEDLDREWQRKLDKAKGPAAAVAPIPESAETGATSPTPSITPP